MENIRVNAVNGISEVSRAITQGVRQGFQLSPVLFNLYLDEVIRIWLQKLKSSKYFRVNFQHTAVCRWPVYYFQHRRQLTKMQYIYYITYLKNIIWKLLQKKTKVFGFVGKEHLRTKIIINDETLEQVSQFTYLGCSISYQFSNDVEFKLAKFLQLIVTIKRIIFKKVRTEIMLEVYNTLVLPTFL